MQMKYFLKIATIGCAIVMSAVTCHASDQLNNIAWDIVDKVVNDYEEIYSASKIHEMIVCEVYKAQSTRPNNKLNTITKQVTEMIDICNSKIRWHDRMDPENSVNKEIEGLNSAQVAEILQKFNYAYEN